MTEILDTETAKKRLRSKRFFRVRSGLDAISYSAHRSWIDEILEHAEFNDFNKVYVPFTYSFGIRRKHWNYITLRLWLKRQKEVGTLFGLSLRDETQIVQLGLPPELYDFKEQLEYLNLSKCKLHELPKGIEKFTQLQQIDLSQNKLSNIDALSKLNLQFLNISRNELPYYPKWLENIQHCKLELAIGWAYNLYKKIWNSTLINHWNYMYGEESTSPEGVIANMQNDLHKVEQNWNKLGLRTKSRSKKSLSSSHPIYTPPAQHIAQAFLFKTRINRGRLRFSSQKRNIRPYRFLTLWALQKLNLHTSIYYAGMNELEYENWKEKYNISLPKVRHFYKSHDGKVNFSEDYDFLNSLYNGISISRNQIYTLYSHRIITKEQSQYWWLNKDVAYPYQEVRYDVEHNFSYRKKCPVRIDVTDEQSLVNSWTCFWTARQKIQHLAFMNRLQHINHRYDSKDQKNIWQTSPPKKLLFRWNPPIDSILNRYHSLDNVEEITIQLTNTTMPDLSGCKNLKILRIQNSMITFACREKLPSKTQIIIDDNLSHLIHGKLQRTTKMSPTSEHQYWDYIKQRYVYFDLDPQNLTYQVDKRDKSKKGEEQLHDSHIELRKCNLTEIPEWLKNTTGTGTIDLRENQITHIPQWLIQIPGIKRIFLDHNPISNLDHLNLRDSAFSLYNLSFRHCQLTEIPQSVALHVSTSKHNFNLDLRHNQIQKVCYLMPNKYGGRIYMGWWSSPGSLGNIRLEGNPLQKIFF